MRQPFTRFFILLLVLCRLLAAGQTPVLTASPGSLSGFSTAVGTPSAQQTVLVSGSSLTGNVTATAPAGFEISWTSGFSFGTSVVLTQAGGLVTNVPLYVRLTGTALGPVSGTISMASVGTMTVSVAVSGTVTSGPTANPQAVLTSISPTSGTGGTQVLITFNGSNFVPGAFVDFQAGNGASFTATYVSSTQLTALVALPSVTAPTVTYFGAANPPPGGGGSSPQMLFFTIIPGPPIITRFSPTSGPVGTSVTIYGTNLGAGNGGGATIFFNGTQAAPFPRVPSPTEVYALVPQGATTGLVTVTNSNGAAVSAAPFTVTPTPPAFFENFEQGTKTAYAPASVQLQSGGWTFAEALIGTSAGIDKFNGSRSARLRGGGFIEMDVDKPNGAGIVTVSAATYATEIGASFIPEISTNGGVTYTSLLGSNSAPVLTGTLTPYSFTVNRTGDIRLRFSSTNTGMATNPRINMDDIGITDYRVGTAAQAGQPLPELAIFPNPAHNQITVRGVGAGPVQASLYDLSGRLLLAPAVLPATQLLHLPAGLPAGVYLLQVTTSAGSRTVRLLTE